MAKFSEVLEAFAVEEEVKDGYLALCPSHPDTHPSLVISRGDKGDNVVIVCRAGCDTYDILKAAGLSWAQLFGVSFDGYTLAPVAKTQRVGISEKAMLAGYVFKTTQDAAPAIDYASRRFGIDEVTFKRLNLGFDNGSVNVAGLRVNGMHDTERLVIPFYAFDGSTHYVQARAIDPNYSGHKWSGPANPPGLSWGEYGWFDLGATDRPVIITEGPGDALTAVAAGFDAVGIRGAGLGSNADLATEIAEALAGRKVIIAGDNDTAGQKFTNDLAANLHGRLDVFKLVIPSGANDLTEWRNLDGFDIEANAIRYVPVPVVETDWTQYAADWNDDDERGNYLLAYIREQGLDVRFTETGWMLWDGNSWGPCNEREIWQQLRGLKMKLMAVAESLPGAARIKMESRAGYLGNEGKGTAAIKALSRMVWKPITEFDMHHDELAVANGIVSLRTGELRPYTKEDFVTRRVRYEYKKGAARPDFDKFLGEVFVDNAGNSDPELAAYVQKLVGYGITGSTEEQILAIFTGTGANGKGVLTEVLGSVFREFAKFPMFDTFEKRPNKSATSDLASLYSARLVIASEGESDGALKQSLLKRLSGGDPITAAFKYANEFDFKPEFLIILMTNHLPVLKGDDAAMWRRIKVIPFNATFPEGKRDIHLAGKLIANEAEGILAWAVEGAVRWYAEGLGNVEAVQQKTVEYRTAQDTLALFIEEYAEIDPTATVLGKDIWQSYREWTLEDGDAATFRSKGKLWEALDSKGFKLAKNERRMPVIRGLRLLSDSEREGRLARARQELSQTPKDAEPFPV